MDSSWLALFLTQFQRIFAITLPESTGQQDVLSLAGVFTGVNIDFIYEVRSVSDKALVSDFAAADLLKVLTGAWWVHINILQKYAIKP
jgi:hypothetical protein